MCIPVAAVAAISTVASVGGQVASHMGNRRAVAEQNLHAMKVETLNQQFRTKVMEHQNKVYAQDVKYGGEVLAYQRDEFRRQGEHLDRATENIQKSYFTQVGTLMKRMVEEDIAAVLQMEDVGKTSRRERASRQVQADARGVEGNSVEAVINDVARQEGEAVTVMEMNRSATQRQLMLEAQQLKTNADGAIMNLPVRTYQPMAPVQAPAPVSPVQPQAMASKPSMGALAANVTGSLVQGASNYASWTGQSMAQAFRIK